MIRARRIVPAGALVVGSRALSRGGGDDVGQPVAGAECEEGPEHVSGTRQPLVHADEVAVRSARERQLLDVEGGVGEPQFVAPVIRFGARGRSGAMAVDHPGGWVAITDEVEHPYEWMRAEHADIPVFIAWGQVPS